MANRCEIYTPIKVVKNMLNLVDYKGSKILDKHIIDNSFGKGAFLLEIVDLYIREYFKVDSDINRLSRNLENFIHGIEINKKSVIYTKAQLNLLLKKYNITNRINWDIACGDALKVNKYDTKMDYVIGNPPYVNIHNLVDVDYRKFIFTQNGMIDLYLIFFELGIKMLNKTGKLIYITPNSFLTSKAGEIFRKKIINDKLLVKYIDNKHNLIFKNIQTYTGITLLDRENKEDICRYENKDNKVVKKLKYSDFFINQKFYFDAFSNSNISKILNFKLNSDIIIRNGLATNANNVFFGYKKDTIFSKKIFKIKNLNNSELTLGKGIFPYDNEYKLYSIDYIKDKDTDLFNYLNLNKNILIKRALKEGQKWWEYSRTQGLFALENKKLVISNIMRAEDQVTLKELEKDILVYGSGYYIYSKSNEYNIKWIKKMFADLKIKRDFIDYITLIGKNKGSSYYFFSTEDLNRFISYNIEIYKQEKKLNKLSNNFINLLEYND